MHCLSNIWEHRHKNDYNKTIWYCHLYTKSQSRKDWARLNLTLWWNSLYSNVFGNQPVAVCVRSIYDSSFYEENHFYKKRVFMKNINILTYTTRIYKLMWLGLRRKVLMKVNQQIITSNNCNILHLCATKSLHDRQAHSLESDVERAKVIK